MKASRTKELARALHQLTEGKPEAEIKQATHDFAGYLYRKGMLSQADAIMEEYRKIYNQENGIVEATVMLTNRLPEATRIELREALKKKYNAREVHMLEKVDQRLIGGMKVRVGDEVFDASVQNSLKKLQAQLLK